MFHTGVVVSCCVCSDLGSQEEERETPEKEPENQGPQPQPAVITSIINDQVHTPYSHYTIDRVLNVQYISSTMTLSQMETSVLIVH